MRQEGKLAHRKFTGGLFLRILEHMQNMPKHIKHIPVGDVAMRTHRSGMFFYKIRHIFKKV